MKKILFSLSIVLVAAQLAHAQPISGTKTVGPTGDYSDLSGALFDLEANGISGTVTLQLQDGYFNEQVSVGHIPGADHANRIIIESQSGNPEDVLIYYNPDVSDNYVLHFDSAGYFTLRNLTLSTSGADDYGHIIHLARGCNSFKVESCHFIDSARAYLNNSMIYRYETSNTGNCDTISITNSTFKLGARGLFLVNAFHAYNTYINIQNNSFINQRNYSIYLSQMESGGLILNNKIRLDSTNTNYVAMDIGSLREPAMVAHNYIKLNTTSSFTTVKGIRQYRSRYNVFGVMYYNNVIDITAVDDAIGIEVDDGESVRYYHNSVNVECTNPSTNTSAALWVTNGGDHDMQNNSFVNHSSSASSYAIYVENPGAGPDFTGTDYNNFYTNGSNFGYWNDGSGDVNRATMLSNLSLSDANNQAVLTGTTIGTNDYPYPCDSLLAGLGTANPFVTIDFFGNARPDPPAIGAFEPASYPTIQTWTMQGDVCRNHYDSLQLQTVIEDESYLWSTGGSTFGIGVTPSANTTYYVTLSSGRCSFIDSASVSVFDPVPPVFTSDTLFCDGQNITITATGTDSLYLINDTGLVVARDKGSVSYNAGTKAVGTGYKFYGLQGYTGGCASEYDSLLVDVAVNPEYNTSSKEDISCNGEADGSLTIGATSGTGTLTYSIGSGYQASNTFSDLSAGAYTATVSDINGCKAVGSTVTITEPAAIGLSSTLDMPACYGSGDGSISVEATGGTGSYSYAWEGSTSNTNQATGLAAGTYALTVTDGSSCTKVLSGISLGQPDSISLSASITNASCASTCQDGAIDLSVSGGTAPYSFSWTGSLSTEDISSLASGDYSVSVTDSNSCTASASYTVSYGTAIVDVEKGAVSIYPNPLSSDYLQLESSEAIVQLAIYDMNGTKVYQQVNPGSSIKLNGLKAGLYYICIRTENAEISQKLIVQ